MNLIQLEANAGEAKANLVATLEHIRSKSPDHWSIRNLEKVENHLYQQHEYIISMAKKINKLNEEIRALNEWKD